MPRVIHWDRQSDSDDSSGVHDKAAQAGYFSRLLRFFSANNHRLTPEFFTFVVRETGRGKTFVQKMLEQGVLRRGDVLMASSVDRYTRMGPVAFAAFVRACSAAGVLVGAYLVGDARWRVARDGGGSGRVGVRYATLFNGDVITAMADIPLTVTRVGPLVS